MMFKIGDLNRRVELQSPVSIPDGMGALIPSYETVATVWAAIWSTHGSEELKSGQLSMTTSHRIRIWYYADLEADWRIKRGDDYYSIVGIINPNMSNEYLDLLCKETG